MRIAQFNVENLFLYLDKYKGENLDKLTENQWQSLSSSNADIKSLEKTSKIASIINDIGAEIYVLNEVGGIESLKAFCNHFLNDDYTPYLIEGNSDRGIDVGYIVKASSKLNYQLKTNKDRKLSGTYYNSEEVLYMSRDIAEMHISDDTGTKIIILGVHLKSRLDPKFIDHQGKHRRALESELLAVRYNELSKEHPETLILAAGDFNGEVNQYFYNEEFDVIKNTTDLIDCFDIAQVERDKRITQVMINRYKDNEYLQFDHILIPKKHSSLLNASGCYVYYFKNEMGLVEKIPQTLEEKQRMPSDHYPTVVEINI